MGWHRAKARGQPRWAGLRDTDSAMHLHSTQSPQAPHPWASSICLSQEGSNSPQPAGRILPMDKASVSERAQMSTLTQVGKLDEALPRDPGLCICPGSSETSEQQTGPLPRSHSGPAVPHLQSPGTVPPLQCRAPGVASGGILGSSPCIVRPPGPGGRTRQAGMLTSHKSASSNLQPCHPMFQHDPPWAGCRKRPDLASPPACCTGSTSVSRDFPEPELPCPAPRTLTPPDQQLPAHRGAGSSWAWCHSQSLEHG